MRITSIVIARASSTSLCVEVMTAPPARHRTTRARALRALLPPVRRDEFLRYPCFLLLIAFNMGTGQQAQAPGEHPRFSAVSRRLPQGYPKRKNLWACENQRAC